MIKDAFTQLISEDLNNAILFTQIAMGILGLIVLAIAAVMM